MARVVVLTGVSSAGKSSLARKMQDQAKRDWLHVTFDKFISMIPVGRETSPDWFVVRNAAKDPDVPEISFTSGPRGLELRQAMRDFVRVAADRGIDMIVDDVCTTLEVDDYRSQLADHELTIVRVDVPLAAAERREKARGDRMIGLTRNQAGRIHEGIDYDLTVVNDDGQLDACAARILAAVDAND